MDTTLFNERKSYYFWVINNRLLYRLTVYLGQDCWRTVKFRKYRINFFIKVPDGGVKFLSQVSLLLSGILQMFYLTIIPRAQMGSESIAHEAEWAIDSEAMRARGIIVLEKYN